MTPAVQWLLALNIGVYFLQLTLFGTDAVYSALALDPGEVSRRTGGRSCTYMFVHAWLAHLAFNMFTLWMFGPRLEQEWGTRELRPVLSVVRTRRRASRICCSRSIRR